MNELLELVDIVSKKRTNKLEILGATKDEISKVQQFYNGINDGKIKTDKEALSYLYGLTETNQKYTKLKNRLENKLINTLFFLDLEDKNTSELRKYYSISCKNWAASRLLLARGKEHTAIKISIKGVKIASKFELTDVGLLFARQLRIYYGSRNFDKKKFNYYNDLFFELFKKFETETIAEGYASEITYLRNAPKIDKLQIIEKASKYCIELNSMRIESDTYRTSLFYFVCASILHEAKGDVKSLTKISKEAIDYFTKKPFDTIVVRTIFLNKLQSVYIRQRKDEEVEKLFIERLRILKSTGSWPEIMNQYLIYNFHRKNYSKSLELFLSCVKEINKIPVSKNFSQQWSITEAYTNFLIQLGKINPTKEELELIPKFRLYKFLNNIPLYSKEKSGRNIPILIIHVLFLLQMRKYNQIIDRTEALNQYAYRYLRKDDTFRSNAFIKMLLCAPKADFNRIRTERYAQKYRDKLTSMPWEKSTSPLDVEIIPYEDLWEFVLELLD